MIYLSSNLSSCNRMGIGPKTPSLSTAQQTVVNITERSLRPSEEKAAKWMNKGKLLGFNRCECASHTSKKREAIEEKILSEFTKLYPDKDMQYHILSIGSGELLQDFLLLKSLVHLGYKNINITFVGPTFNNNHFKKLFLNIEDWTEKTNQKKGIKLTVEKLSSVDDVLNSQPEKKYHCVYAIDMCVLKSCWENVIFKLRECLSNDAPMFVTAFNKRIVIKKDDFKLNEEKGNGWQEPKIIHDYVNNHTNNEKTIHLAVYDPDNFIESGFLYLADLVAKGYKKFTIDLNTHPDYISSSTKNDIESLIKSYTNNNPNIQIELKLVDKFGDKYDIMFVHSIELINNKYFIKEKLLEKIKKKGMIILELGGYESDYALRKSGIYQSENSRFVQEKTKRRNEVLDATNEFKRTFEDKLVYF